VPISDVIDADISSWFSTCNDFIHVARRNKGSVLVHWYQLTDTFGFHPVVDSYRIVEILGGIKIENAREGIMNIT